MIKRVTVTRTSRSLLLAIATAIALSPGLAGAQSKQDLEKAKKAFVEGKAKFDKGQYEDAVERFKESYRLSKNPLLLYNIALTFQRLESNDMALFYYRKFLSDAPPDAAQRAEAEAAVAELEKQFKPAGAEVKPAGGDETAPDKVEEAPKPRRTAACTVEEIQHQVVEDAPPGRPLDLTAFVPEDCGWTVTLYFRGAGEDKFTVADMRPRYNELVARIPAEKMAGNAVQYYVEVKNDKGELVHKIGKSTSPNVVYIDEAARPRYYPDLDTTVGTTGEPPRVDDFVDEEDPLTGRKRIIEDESPPGMGPTPPAGGGGGGGTTPAAGGGFMDVGSSKFTYGKWVSTGIGAGGLALSMTFYLMASSWAGSLEGEAAASTNSDCAGGPPCRTFDEYRKDIEATGQRYETLSKVSFVVGLAGGAIAGVYWYKEFRAKKKGERVTQTASGLRSIIATPVAGDDFVGGAAAFRF